jgi:hypothetical protein
MFNGISNIHQADLLLLLLFVMPFGWTAKDNSEMCHTFISTQAAE